MRGARTTLVLFLVLAGLVVFLVYSNSAEQANATPTPSTYLWDLTADAVSSLKVVDNTRQTELTLSRAGAGQWQVESSKITSGQVLLPAQPADSGQAEYGASLVSTLFLRRTLTETTQLGEYGLMAPPYTVQVKQSDGSELNMRVGYKTPTNDGYYVLREGEVNPQIVSASALDPLFGFVDNPPLQATPTVVAPSPGGTPQAATGTPTP